MPDIGQSKAEIEVKIKELELFVKQKGIAKDRIELELMKARVQAQKFEQSVKDIDEEIKNAEADKESLQQSLANPEL